MNETAADTVVVVAEITANSIPPLPHPVKATFTFTVGSNGKVTRVVGITDPQTVKDFEELAASESVGMPKTGAANNSGLLLLALGLLIVLLGGVVRRFSASRVA